jgi:hypothetical protein
MCCTHREMIQQRFEISPRLLPTVGLSHPRKRSPSEDEDGYCEDDERGSF